MIKMQKLTILFTLAISLFLTQSILANEQYKAFKSNPNSESAFAYLHQVATHPRCANCHGVVEDGMHRPTVGDNRHPHPMNITLLNNISLTIKDGVFVQSGNAHPVNCRSCHQNQNGDEPGMPPGAANDLMPGFVWHMPPVTMAVARDLDAKTLCQNWLNPAKNSFLAFRGSKEQIDIFEKEFVHHAKDDPLVRWSWEPGIGRTPAPGTHNDFVKAMKLWIKGGMPCPSS